MAQEEKLREIGVFFCRAARSCRPIFPLALETSFETVEVVGVVAKYEYGNCVDLVWLQELGHIGLYFVDRCSFNLVLLKELL